MLEMLLNKTDQDKLIIFKMLGEPVSIKKIMSITLKSRTVVKKNIFELNDDISDLGEIEIRSIRSGIYNVAISDGKLEQVYEYLIYKYFDRSLLFNLFLFLLTDKKIEITKLSERLSISETYCYELINKLNGKLASFSIKIICRNKNAYLNAKEGLIRFLLVTLSTKIYLGRKWPFEVSRDTVVNNIDQKVFSSISKNSKEIREKIIIHNAVLTIRQKYQIEESFTDYQYGMLNLLIKTHDLTLYNPNQFHTSLDANNDLKEKMLANMLIRLLFSNVEKSDVKEVIGEKIFYDNSDLFLSVKKIVLAIIKEFGLNTDDKYHFHLLYTVGFFFLIASYFKVDLESISVLFKEDGNDTIRKSDSIYRKISMFSNREVNDNEDLAFLTPCMQLFTDTLYVSLKGKYDKTVKIYYQFLNHPLFSDSFLNNRIQFYFPTECFTITNNIFEADFIITDTFIEQEFSGEIFYIDDVFDFDSWKKVISEIQDKTFLKYSF